MKIAGIDVHKKVLMVVVVDDNAPEEKLARRRFVTLPSELQLGQLTEVLHQHDAGFSIPFVVVKN